MEITTRTVLEFFLKKLEDQMITNDPSGISSFFQNFFTHEELIEIIKWKYDKRHHNDIELGAMDKKELEDIIRSDTYILAYYRSIWKQEIQSKESPSKEEVKVVLKQLCLHAHYLLDKPIEKWDEYDTGNFLSLQIKAGRLQRVYGLYDTEVEQAEVEKVDSLPRRFYNSQQLAQSELLYLIESNQDREDEVHILSTLKAT